MMLYGVIPSNEKIILWYKTKGDSAWTAHSTGTVLYCVLNDALTGVAVTVVWTKRLQSNYPVNQRQQSPPEEGLSISYAIRHEAHDRPSAMLCC
jgi:hypothetical protein